MGRIVTCRLPVDLHQSLAPLVAATHDPTIRLAADELWWARHTPDGPATLHVRRHGDRFAAQAFGPGASWALEQTPALLGAHDDLSAFTADGHPRVARAHHRRPGLRIVRTGQVWDLLVQTVLAQRVTGREAARSWVRLVRRFGSPAPGPGGLWLPPTPQAVSQIPHWDWHLLGVDRARAQAIALAGRRIARLEEAVRMPPDGAQSRLCALPGVGPWTAALVLRMAAGHADAVEVGDFHVAHHVGWNLAGEPRADDTRMLELLAPFSGHRGRVVRLLLAEGQRAPAFGPRQRIVAVDRL